MPIGLVQIHGHMEGLRGRLFCVWLAGMVTEASSAGAEEQDHHQRSREGKGVPDELEWLAIHGKSLG